ncbi:MAG: DUF6046 domain-containing protein [Prevotella sp.]|jgi:hypothetical protein|nr:DUF6046 domain-containing protein [Prevotella sp.]
MRYVVDIFKRFQSVYGFVGANAQGLANRGVFAAGIAYNNAKYKGLSNSKEFGNIPVYTVAEYNFADMEMRYEDQILKFSFDSLLHDTSDIIAPPPMVSFRRSKNLGITVIDDGDESEIVENFGINSWDIDIKGLFVDMAEHQYPQSKIKDFARFFEINDVIEIVSPLFQDLGIHSIYFKEQSVEPVEGFPDTVKFTIQAKSIKSAEFSIING